jgi:hypothetical protein
MQDQDRFHPSKTRTIDRIVFTLANLLNLFMIYIFLSRTGLVPSLGSAFAWVWLIFILLLIGVVGVNLRLKRKYWFIVLPAFLIAFLLLEIILDYILKVEFRSTRLLGPYLLMYYLSLMGMIGYTFQIGKKYGFITLITYFLNQIATFYSYFLVGHGV